MVDCRGPADFFFSSVLISIQVDGLQESSVVQRDGRQVWANGFWLAFALLLALFLQEPIFLVAAGGAIAAATADTWATELGSRRFDVKTYHPIDFKQISAGTQGGVSGAGLLASWLGSGAIAGIYLLFTAHFISFLFIWFAGFAGALIDSFLGATVQGREYNLYLIGASPVKICINNDVVNALAVGVGSLSTLILVSV